MVFCVSRTSAVLSWKPIPMRHQNGEILHYLIKYKRLSHSVQALVQERNVRGDQLTFTLSLLEPKSTYIVSIAGVNRAGIGKFSPPLSFTTLASYEQTLPRRGSCQSSIPGKVVVTSTNSTSDSITIQWLPPCDERNRPLNVILKYSYQKRFRRVVLRRELSRTKWTVKDLDSGLDVHFSLKAVNSRGKKGPSTKVTVRTQDIPVSYIYIYASYYHNSISFDI